MVIIRLTGGLGNQMFQYAAGRTAALRNGTSLVLNTEFYKARPNKLAHEEVYLNLFPAIKAQQLRCLSASDVFELEDKSRGFFRRKYNKLLAALNLPLSFRTVAEHTLLHYQPDFNQHRATVLNFTSDWQNEKYFIDFKSVIEQDFVFPALLTDSLNASVLVAMQTTTSVAIHVRRGDYLTSSTHTPTSVTYYNKAIALIHSKVLDPHFFVFSDDILWCQKNLNLTNAQYINHNTNEQSYVDMQLMSNCKHNIIANSSFSWWGAWLNQNPEKLVIAPEMWLEKANIRAEQIIPNAWIAL